MACIFHLDTKMDLKIEISSYIYNFCGLETKPEINDRTYIT